jgi:hypothetical protein
MPIAEIPDDCALAFAQLESRVIVTNNRRDFIRLHRTRAGHVGIAVISSNPDFIGIARRIDRALIDRQAM